MQSAGKTPVNLSVQSDAQGTFKMQLTPESTDVGTTTVTAAVAGTSCSATASYTVSVAAARAASAGPTHRPGPNTSTVIDGSPWGAPSGLVPFALVLLLIGVSGLLLARFRGAR